MIDLTEFEWKEFKVKQIFEKIEKCKCGNVSSLQVGEVPYIGATNRNNGVMSYVDATDKVTKGNCIVFICDGQGSIGYSIYKEHDFVGSTTLKVGRYSGINRYNANFIVSALDKNRIIYNYGYKRTEKRLKNETIYLPADINGEPDFELMEQYIRNLERQKREQYVSIAKERRAKLSEHILPKLEEMRWKEFFIVDLFPEIKRGKRLTKANQEKGDVPYVSSTGLNNGVDNFIDIKDEMRSYSNCLSIANSGSVGASFYEPFKYVASDHVTHLKNENFSKYVYFFIASLTNRWSEKYNYNREINDKRISREKIVLPVKEDDTPDYEYMEKYMENIFQKKYDEYINNIQQEEYKEK